MRATTLYEIYGPLWEKHPGLQPKRGRHHLVLFMGEWCWMICEHGIKDDDRQVVAESTDTAAALSRVLLEDWIIGLGASDWCQFSIFTKDKGSHDKVVTKIQCPNIDVFGHCTHDGYDDGNSAETHEEAVHRALVEVVESALQLIRAQ